MQEKIKDDSELWESGQLGASPEHMQPAPAELEKEIDDAMNVEAVTIRLDKALVADLKNLAKDDELAFQAFLRKVLTGYRDCRK
ncbi:MAG: hypothetical protein KGS72_27045 [Cyanobacteria bacterium REEB67]|nr:hypothetical protein [Cyanobacteria bacterium REEB67]